MDILKKLRFRNKIRFDIRPATTFEGYPILDITTFSKIKPPDTEDTVIVMITDEGNLITSQVSSYKEDWLEDVVFYD